jgi:hypothetical protein
VPPSSSLAGQMVHDLDCCSGQNYGLWNRSVVPCTVKWCCIHNIAVAAAAVAARSARCSSKGVW